MTKYDGILGIKIKIFHDCEKYNCITIYGDDMFYHNFIKRCIFGFDRNSGKFKIVGSNNEKIYLSNKKKNILSFCCRNIYTSNNNFETKYLFNDTLPFCKKPFWVSWEL